MSIKGQVRQMDDNEALWADVDKLFIPSREIDKHEQDQFGDRVFSAQT